MKTIRECRKELKEKYGAILSLSQWRPFKELPQCAIYTAIINIGPVAIDVGTLGLCRKGSLRFTGFSTGRKAANAALEWAREHLKEKG